MTGPLKDNPTVSRLGDAARDYAKARGGDLARKAAGRLGDLTESMGDKAEGGGFALPAVSSALQRVREGDNPVKAAVGGVATGVKEKVKSAFGGGGGAPKTISIIEDVSVGVPVDVAYDQWTQFQEFSSFMKGVDSVDQADEVTTNWRVKVFKSRRNWQAKITEQVPDRRIAWTSEGAKGTTKGVVTFHPLADDLTQVLLVIEYYPQGLFEKTGNIWRAQGRRARLDLKHFRRFVMMRGEATGSWRGEIRDGEVVRGPDEGDEQRRGRPTDERGEADEEQEPDEEQDGEEAEDEYGEDEEPEEEEEEPEEEEPEPEDEEEEEEEEEEEPEQERRPARQQGRGDGRRRRPAASGAGRGR